MLDIQCKCGWRTTLTCTLGSGSERRSWRSGAALVRPGEEDADLVLGVGVQVANFVVGFVHGLIVDQAAGQGAVLHLFLDDGPVAVDGVGVELDPQVRGAHGGQLRRSDGNRRLWTHG